MSASRNDESLINQGEFSSKVPPSEPLTTHGHKPGVKVGNDALPEFSAETHPAGTAPKESTFSPNTQSEIPGQAGSPEMDPSSRSDPLDFPGATSGSVHQETEFGKPAESDQPKSGKKDRTGVEGRVTSGSEGVETGDGSVEQKARGLGADEKN